MWWKAAVGSCVVVFSVREMFQDLFHPTRSGALSEFVGYRLFWVLRRWPSMLASAGPLAVVIVIFVWAILLVTGFAFIYWSVFPEAFQLRTANQPTDRDSFWWCFYYSLEMLTTLGLGDIEPKENWLRILSGSHTLLGFSLVTASITWIVLLFPALSRARTLARKVHTLGDSERQTGVPLTSKGMHNLISMLAEEVIRTRVDLVHYPILFYFYAEERNSSLAAAMFPLMRLAASGTEPDRDDLVRFAATGLQTALRDLADKIGERLDLQDRSPEGAFRAFAELHLKA